MGPLLGPLIAAFVAWKFATILLTGTLWALNFVIVTITLSGRALVGIFYLLRAAIIGVQIAILLIPLGIIALVAVVIGALVLMYFKVEWFRNAVNASWAWIMQAAIDAWGWIKQATLDTLTWMKTAFDDTKDHFLGIIGGMKQAWEDFMAILHGDTSAVDIDTSKLGLPSGGGSLLGSLWDMIPGKAGGGMIPLGTAAVVGEGGRPELAMAGPTGTMISPISTSPPADIKLNPIQIVRLSTSVQVDKREIARAQDEFEIHQKNRRGEP